MGLFGDILGGIGSWLQGDSDKEASQRLAEQQRLAGEAAANAARFRPVGVTGSPFGTSNFSYDAQGNLTGANYSAAPWLAGQQNQLQGASGGMLSQFTGSMDATRPMGTAAQTMFDVGRSYLNTDRAAAERDYMNRFEDLQRTSRDEQLAELRARQQATGSSGLAVGDGTNPELNSYFRAVEQARKENALNAISGAQRDLTFGAEFTRGGGGLLRDMYGTQVAASSPYSTAMGILQNQDALAQSSMLQGMEFGKAIQPSKQASGAALAQGMTNAAQTQFGIDRYNPWATMLQGAGNMLGKYESQIGSMFGLGQPPGGMGGGINPAAVQAPQLSNYQWGLPQAQLPGASPTTLSAFGTGQPMFSAPAPRFGFNQGGW